MSSVEEETSLQQWLKTMRGNKKKDEVAGWAPPTTRTWMMTKFHASDSGKVVLSPLALRSLVGGEGNRARLVSGCRGTSTEKAAMAMVD